MSLGEFDIIARYFTPCAQRADVLLGVGDDAAVLEPSGDRKLVVAMDTIIEGVHFPAQTAAVDIGWRALAVNLSDLAAMGAEPAWMTLSLSTPGVDEQWLAGFAAGLFEAADRYGVALVGGDTVRGPLVITVQLGGWVESDGWLTRSGARAGDSLYVSGAPGEAAAGLAVIQRELPADPAAALLRQRFLRPTPRIELGRQLRRVASAAMDVSDGLLTDVEKLVAASDCGALLNVALLPQSPSMRALFDAQDCVEYALAGGDDYEIIFTLSPDTVHDAPNVEGVALTRIGVITAERGVRCERGGESFRMNRGGYDHFADRDASR